MAYARLGEDSDIYLYRSGKDTLECSDCPLITDKHSPAHPPFILLSDSQLVPHLVEHVHAGHRVGSALDRALAEAEGRRWQTDVERVVAEMQGESGECICRTAGCEHPASFHTGPRGACRLCHKECWL